jgi:DNA-binding CsgD family transcriptional regulator/tetratricopeptide (TPR) repeat protein
MSDPYASIGHVPRLGSGVAFVARNTELEQLAAALRRADDGAAGALLLSGEAGVGKSRLLSEFSSHAENEGALVLLGRCLGVGDAGLPYLPFTEIFERLQASHPEAVAAWPVLAGLAGVGGMSNLPSPAPADDGGSKLGQLRLFDAVLGALTEIAADRSVVLAIEDLHWADPSTRDLLSFLLSRISRQRLLVVATYRSDDLNRQHPLRPLLAELVRLPVVERLDLQPFDLNDARTFVRALADEALDDDAVDRVAERSEGNAFFAEELLAAAATHAGGIPTALADVLLSRVEQLGPPAQRVVRAASVTGWRHVRHPTLAGVLGMGYDELDLALREAIAHHILVPSESFADAYTFRHALLREAMYADLLPGERVRLHTAYAKLATENPDPRAAEYLAFHSLHSNDLGTALAASVRAADYAMSVGALSAEFRHVEQALELWDAVDDAEARAGVNELALLRKAAYVAAAAGHPERGLAYARAAAARAETANDPVERADAHRQLAEALLTDGRSDEAFDAIKEAWRLVENTEPSKVRARVLAALARCVQNDIHDSRTYAEAAIADARAAGSASAQADALITLAYTDLREGRADEACDLLVRAGEKAAEAGAHEVELRAKLNLCVNEYELGRLDRAATAADDGVARATEVGLTWSPFGRALRWMQVMTHYARGDWDRAAAAATPPDEQVSDTISALIAAAGGLIQAGRGQFGAAKRMFAKVRPEWPHDDQIAQLSGVAGAEIAGWEGDPVAAMQLIDEALDTVRKQSSSEWPLAGIRMATLALGAAADLAAQARHRHDPRAERDAVDSGLRYAEFAQNTAEHGMPRTATLGPEGLAWLARCRAERSRLLAENDPAPWREVIEAFGYGEIYPQALARWRLADVLATTGDRAGAAAELTAALEVADRLCAEPLADACRSLANRARLGITGAIAPVADTLTPREAAVLGLVAAGRTNRQIGEELFISEKTVSVHVSRVMAKLEAASRTEAVSIAYQRGLLTQRH